MRQVIELLLLFDTLAARAFTAQYLAARSLSAIICMYILVLILVVYIYNQYLTIVRYFLKVSQTDLNTAESKIQEN